MKLFFASILASFGLVGASFSGDIPGSNFSYGNWSGAAYFSDNSGEFSHCAIRAEYVSGNSLLFSVNWDASVTVGVSGALGLVEGQQFPVALYVDRRSPFYGTAQALGSDFAILNIPDFDAAMRAFQQGYTLNIEALGTVTPYSLKGTFRALAAARNCALRNYGYKVNLKTGSPKSLDKTALFQLTTMIISEVGISDFRYLSEVELLERGWENSVAWESEVSGMSGFALIMPRDGLDDLRTTDAEDTRFIAKSCHGDYATSSRSVDIEAGAIARELRLICSVGDVQSETYLSKFFTQNDVVYTVLTYRDIAGSVDRANRKEQNESVLLRAVKFASE